MYLAATYDDYATRGESENPNIEHRGPANISGFYRVTA